MTRQTVTTTVKEYDEEGRLVKETVTTSEYDWPELGQLPNGQPQPQYPWWQYPYQWWQTSSAPTTTTTTTMPNTCYYQTINGLHVVGEGGDDGEAVSA